MNLSSICTRLILLLGFSTYPLFSAEMVINKHGVHGYEDTPYLSWVPYRVHDNRRPKPQHVEAMPNLAAPPSDAIVLFDGRSMNQWDSSTTWKVENETLVTVEGALTSKASFGDCQIHVEFMVPAEAPNKFTNRGNNGVGIMGLYEIQIFDSHPMHEKQLYADGQCAAIYGETPPLVNACRKPGEWQSFDITFTAPVFEGDQLVSPAYVTVYHNGVLVHHHEKIHGPTLHRAIAPYKAHAPQLPLTFKGHGSPVAFRNIWVRPLN